MVVRASRVTKTSILSGGGTDTVKSSPGRVFWAASSATGAGPSTFDFIDNTSGTTPQVTRFQLPSGSVKFFSFDPPLEFATGIRVRRQQFTPKITFGYE